MTQRTVRTGCPLDCYGTCTLLATVEDGRVTGVRGDPDHPVTRGLVCRKAQLQVERMYVADRLTTPLRRTATGFAPISWDAALDEIAARLRETRERYGTLSVLYFAGSGSMATLKSLDSRFWNLFGGITTPVGSLCLGAGQAAQVDDFGAALMNDPADVVNARYIVLWGRNPVWTNIHLVPLLREAKQRGAKVVLIDPLRTASAALADEHISTRPGSDGALAHGMAAAIIAAGLVADDYVAANVHGFAEYARMVAQFTPERTEELTGVPAATVVRLAREYASTRPAMLLPGYGIQRYENGGRTIRAIDALAAITGNIGKAGGGVSYLNGYGLGADLSLRDRATARRTVVRVRVADEIAQLTDPPVKFLWTARANPLSQLPDNDRAARVFAGLEFRVAVDFTLTDTALAADIVLPCATPFEAEDAYSGYWHNYLTWGLPAVEPRPDCRTDLEIWADLAERLGFYRDFSGGDIAKADLPGHFLRQALAPLREHGVDLEQLRGGFIRWPGAPMVAWQDGKFLTPSGKFELYSLRAEQRGEEPLPVFVEPRETPRRAGRRYPFQLLTPQARDNLHSQFADRLAPPGKLPVHISPATAERLGLKDGDAVTVTSPRGRLGGVAAVDDAVRDDAVLIYSGGHRHDGNNVNVLTQAIQTDLGRCAAYYDCVCNVTRSEDEAVGPDGDAPADRT
ncbi:MAG: molybdopterin-containing oxidoreductase family protein [Chloroflexota bacterium]